MTDRVRPPHNLEPVLDRLKEDDVFETKQKGLMFAAAVGFALHREEVDQVEIDQYGEGIRMEYFRSKKSPQDEDFIDVLSVCKHEDLNALDPERQEDRVALFERYAVLGLIEMQRACYDDRPDDPLLGILELVDQMQQSTSETLPGLDTAAKQLGRFI